MAASLALFAVAVVLVVLKGGTLARGVARLSHVRLEWLVLAVVAEAGSMVAFGRMQQRLLRAGGADLSLPSMVSITTAANAVTGTLPGGGGWAAAWLYDHLGSRQVARFLRVWMFLVAGGVSSFALFCVIAVGVEIAGSRGPVASLRWLVFLLALIPVVAVVLDAFHTRPPVRQLVEWAERHIERHSEHYGEHPVAHRLHARRRLLDGFRELVSRVSAVRLGPRGWLAVLELALGNWLFDCAVVIVAMEALAVRVPWSGVLVVYGLTQISAAIPVTPGGIGVVEGSMTALLHAYGVPLSSALPVVLLYRIVSFWVLMPIGWAIWGALEMSTRARQLRADRPTSEQP
jgi:uncharacterized protein (TIRG00374 family)